MRLMKKTYPRPLTPLIHSAASLSHQGDACHGPSKHVRKRAVPALVSALPPFGSVLIALSPIGYLRARARFGVWRMKGLTNPASPGAKRATPGHYDPGACGCNRAFARETTCTHRR